MSISCNPRNLFEIQLKQDFNLLLSFTVITMQFIIELYKTITHESVFVENFFEVLSKQATIIKSTFAKITVNNLVYA